jgi:hypothetical protein
MGFLRGIIILGGVNMNYVTARPAQIDPTEVTDVRHGCVVVPSTDSSTITLVEVKVGLKIECRDYIYKMLLNDSYIQNNFKLNVKRLNRWWYSIYFDFKQEESETLYFKNGSSITALNSNGNIRANPKY